MNISSGLLREKSSQRIKISTQCKICGISSGRKTTGEPEHNLPGSVFPLRKPDHPEMQVRLGAHALGFGIIRTPPTRYPPARHLSLLARAVSFEFLEAADDGEIPAPRNRSRVARRSGPNRERRT